MANDKYKMFKNYMYNELGITKEDIKNWVKEAVYEVAENYIEHQFNDYDLIKHIENIIRGRWTTIHPDIYEYVANKIVNMLDLKIKKRR